MKKILKIVAGISMISAVLGTVVYLLYKKQNTTEI